MEIRDQDRIHICSGVRRGWQRFILSKLFSKEASQFLCIIKEHLDLSYDFSLSSSNRLGMESFFEASYWLPLRPLVRSQASLVLLPPSKSLEELKRISIYDIYKPIYKTCGEFIRMVQGLESELTPLPWVRKHITY